MSDVVFILGAGASKATGAPLMAEFLDVADDLVQLGLVERRRPSFDLVRRARAALQPVHSTLRPFLVPSRWRSFSGNWGPSPKGTSVA
jgi:hypothetical protein